MTSSIAPSTRPTSATRANHRAADRGTRTTASVALAALAGAALLGAMAIGLVAGTAPAERASSSAGAAPEAQLTPQPTESVICDPTGRTCLTP